MYVCIYTDIYTYTYIYIFTYIVVYIITYTFMHITNRPLLGIRPCRWHRSLRPHTLVA